MYQINNEKFGHFLAEVRKEKQMTQKDLADKLFVSDKTVSKWERGNSMPNVTLLIPIADVLGITVTELLQGEKLKENKTLNSDVVETLVVNSLDLSLRDTIRQRKKNWIFAFLISIGVVVIEAILLTVSGISIEQMGDSLYISLLMLLFASWLCIFAKELLPTYYDTNKVNFVSQGIFRIHMAGLSFNNANWGYVLTVFRVFTLGTAILYPIICYISFLVGGISLWNTVKYPAIIILLIGMLVTTYIVGFIFSQFVSLVIVNLLGIPEVIFISINFVSIGLLAIYFLAIYVLVLLNLLRRIRKMTVHDFLYFDKQNEKKMFRSNKKRNIIFIVSVILGITAILLWASRWTMENSGKQETLTYLMISMMMLIISIYGVSATCADMLLSVLLKNKKLKYQKDNLFVTRTFASKARTMSFTFGTLSMLILLSLLCLNFSSINKGVYKASEPLPVK